MSSKFCAYILCFQFLITASSGWSSNVNNVLNPKTTMPNENGFDSTLVERLTHAVQMTMDECKKVFKWHRWNCPSSSFSRQADHLANREKAYADALLAAGLIYSISQDCSKGILKNCGCNSSLQQRLQNLPTANSLVQKDWVWGGCSDDTSFAENLVTPLLEDPDIKESIDARGYMNRHNNRIGREIVREKMFKVCKCHGTLQACSLQTCWLKMPNFTEIALELKKRYKNAVLLSYDEIEKGIILGNSARHLSSEPSDGVFKTNNLLYLEKSPDYCLSNNTTGWPGTKGRVCSRSKGKNVTLDERKSCRKICKSCKYKVKKQRKLVKSSCQCEFTWCCDVTCKTCVNLTEEFHCV